MNRMDSLGEDHEQALFLACLDLAPAERAAYLKEVCGEDAGTRERVERLLAAHEQTAKLTLSPPLHSLISEDASERIGLYRLLRMLGEGGMGTVYEAEQLEPVRRRVALKIVKLGMDTKEVVARFMTERQALAAMDHPYIAKVFDAGQTAAGRPYFVMELVEGVPLLEYCDTKRLPVRKRVEILIQVCQAIQHAHLKGVVHRDLKPSNILLTSSSPDLSPKIIDFGIAKAVGLDIPERVTEFTRADQALGTPAYMSPEQAGLGQMDIDTRTDVYSLGVILYELLAGCPPFEGETALEILQQVREREPKAPRAFNPAVDRDLETICLKCLEKDPSRRYHSAQALGEDLGIFLAPRQ